MPLPFCVKFCIISLKEGVRLKRKADIFWLSCSFHGLCQTFHMTAQSFWAYIHVYKLCINVAKIKTLCASVSTPMRPANSHNSHKAFTEQTKWRSWTFLLFALKKILPSLLTSVCATERLTSQEERQLTLTLGFH